MPRPSRAGITGLKKRHQKGCGFKQTPVRCACPWYAKYQGIEVALAKWARRRVVTKREADEALRQFKAAIDGGTFTSKRKKVPTEDDETPQGPKAPRTLGQLINRYVAHADDEGGWAEGSGHAVMVERIRREIGHLALDTLNADALTEWLRVQARGRRWSKKTWNDYRGCLYSFCLFAVDRDWLDRNPVPQVPRKTPKQPKEPEMAVVEARKRADRDGVDMVVYDIHGRVRWRDCFGRDPRQIRLRRWWDRPVSGWHRYTYSY